MSAQNTSRALSEVEVKEIEKGLYSRLTAPSSEEQRIDLVDYSTRNLQRLILAYKTLQARVQS